MQPLRILHVANFNHRKYGGDLYATDRKISNGLIRLGHFVYDFSYRDISRIESPFRTTRIGGHRVNHRLLQACDNLAPDILLLGHSELISGETLAMARKKHPRMRVGLWYVDALFHREKASHVLRRRPHIDQFFATTDGDLLREYGPDGAATAFIPNPVDPSIETGKSFAQQRWTYDFLFCGRDENDMQRRDFLRQLHDRASGFLKPAFRGCLGNPPLTGASYLTLLQQCRMGLNMSRRNDVCRYSSDRIAQLTGNGLLTFCPRVPGMESLYSEEELVYFDDLQDLLEKLRYYQNNQEEGKRIAEKGWLRAHRDYNCQKVCAYMLDLLLERSLSGNYSWLEDHTAQAPTDNH